MNQTKMSICQSCGMPIKTLNDYGTESNGNRSNKFCSFCYKDGGFTKPDISMQEMIDGCVKIMTHYGMPEEKSKSDMQKLIPTLERWNSN